MSEHRLLGEFTAFLAREDKEGCVSWALGKLGTGDVDVITLYTDILAPAQNELVCWQDEHFCIWREHVRTSIVRTVIECCYPFILKEKARQGSPARGKAVVGCPAEEYHELGARMVADFLTVLGYDVTFVGANTPQKDLLAALEYVRPKIVGISVTNFYNLVATKKLVADLRRVRAEKALDFRIVAGGNAFRHNPGAHIDMGIDAVLQTFGEIKRYCQGD